MEYNSMQRKFDVFFGKFRHKKIGIYGIGNNARLIAEYVTGFDICCYIAAEHIGEKFCGLSILSIDDAVNVCEVIIIAAVPSSVNIIFNRIADNLPDEMDVFDMRGNQLSRDSYEENVYWGFSKEKLIEKIKSVDVVSFDIFDTLIQRRYLEVKDFWDYLQKKLNDEGIDIPFSKWRQEAEKTASSFVVAPTLNDIYAEFGKKFGIDGVLVKIIKEKEYIEDLEVIVPRNDVIDILKVARALKKKIYFTSDMYYSSEMMLAILKKCNIPMEGIELLISCEFGMSKADGGLYELLKQRVGNQNILHIGDNYQYDYENALNSGMDSFWIMSHAEKLSISSVSKMMDTKNSDERAFAGQFSAYMFENPFSLCNTKGRLLIDDYYSLAQLVFPITKLFLKYIIEQSKNYDLLLFPSRDGYFLYNMYEKLKLMGGLLIPKAKYFYASRSGVSSAAITNMDDIDAYCSKLWLDKKMNIKAFMDNQFQICVGDELDMTVEMALRDMDITDLMKMIKKYANKILDRAATNRKAYLNYIKSEEIHKYKKIAVIDIVTHGSLVKGISALLGDGIDLIAMGTSSMPNQYISDMKRVRSLYGNINEKLGSAMYSTSELSELHLLLEILYSSKEGQFLRFDEGCVPIFLENSKYNAHLLDGFQQKMEQMLVSDWESYDSISKEYALNILGLLQGKYSYVKSEIKDEFMFNDPFDSYHTEWNILNVINQ